MSVLPVAVTTPREFVRFDVPLWVWGALIAAIVVMLLFDLVVVHRTAHVITMKEAAIESAVWISLGLAFGALAMRAVFIFAGVELIDRFDWVLYVFGAFLLYTAWKIGHHDDSQQVDYNQNIAMRHVRKVVPTTNDYDGQKLFTRENGRRVATPLFAVLVLIEATDVVFAVDSVPAILAVSRVPFIVFAAKRIRDPRPAIAVLSPRATAGSLPLPQYRSRRRPCVRRCQDAPRR